MDIKETGEFLDGLFALDLFLIEQFKDGIQFSDFMDFYSKLTSDPEFRDKLMKAYEGYNLIPAELKDLDLREGLALVNKATAHIPDILDALKGDEENDAA